MDIEFLSPHSLDECAYYLREWRKLKTQMGGDIFSQMDISQLSDEMFEFAVHSQEPFVPVILTGNYFGFGIVGIMQRQDGNTTLINVRTRVSVHPVFLLHSMFWYLNARQLLIQFRDVFINPQIGGARGYAPIHRGSKSKQP